MQWTNTKVRFGAVHMSLHWVIALAFIAMLAIGFIMTSLPFRDPLTYPLFQFHKSLGLTVLALVVLRIVWRSTNVVPSLPVDLKAYEKGLAHLTHYGLYAALLVMPLSGWAMISASSRGIPTEFFGLFEVPKIGFIASSPDKQWIEGVAEDVHATAAWVAIALIALHVAAALFHHVVRRDNVLARMTPGLALRAEKETER